MNLQSNIVNDEKSKQVLKDAIDRIKSIALIHDKIYNSKNISDVDANEYILSLANEVVQNFTENKDVKLQIKTDVERLELDILVPLALILNELITNSLKYGLKDLPKGRIEIDFNQPSEKELKLRYFDSGQWFENPKSDNFGTSLIEIFTEQLEGEFSLEKRKDGTEYLFSFRV